MSGFLGSVTKTATADGCPGKCIHAIASLMCDEVITEVSCPASNMRCCVEKSTSSRPKPPPRENVGLLDALDLGLEMPPRPKAEEKVDDDDEEEEEEEKEITSEKPEKKKRKKKKKTTTAAPATTTTKATTKASKSSTEVRVVCVVTYQDIYSSPSCLMSHCRSLTNRRTRSPAPAH